MKGDRETISCLFFYGVFFNHFFNQQLYICRQSAYLLMYAGAF